MQRTIRTALLALSLTLTPLAARAADVTLTNPLGTNDVKVFILRTLRYSLGFLGIVALIMIIYGGFLMLTTGGNADMIKRAKSAIIWAAVGMAIILSSWIILRFIFKTIYQVSA